MSLKDQPYFPFYVKDFDGDEKLKECDAESHGVYIRIMCLLHKSKTYGKILLEQKYQQLYQQTTQQTPEQNLSTCSEFAFMFALKLLKHLPFTLSEIQRGLCQLLENEVLYIKDNYLCQKRMIKDGIISEKRSSAGKKSASGRGGVNNFVGTKLPTSSSTNEPTKDQQNTAIAIAYANQIDNVGGMGGEEEREDVSLDVIPDFYIGNWHLETEVGNCLSYYKTELEFKNDRAFGVELFHKQYVTLPDDELEERLFVWGRLFNDQIIGKTPKRTMRGDNSWVQHFHNWLNKKDLSQNPIGSLPNGKPTTQAKFKTADELLANRR